MAPSPLISLAVAAVIAAVVVLGLVITSLQILYQRSMYCYLPAASLPTIVYYTFVCVGRLVA